MTLTLPTLATAQPEMYFVVLRADGQTAVTAYLHGGEAVIGRYATRREACEAVWKVIA